MALSQTEMNEAAALLGDTSKSEQERTRDFYAYLISKGEEYGRLGLGVTNNDTWQGELANGFAASGDDNNTADVSYGSDDWTALNLVLAQRHLQAYVDNQGGVPDWEQIQDYHNEEYVSIGLDVNDWFPNKMLNGSADPDALWNDWMNNNSPVDIWEDAIDIAREGGTLVLPPYLMMQAIFDPQSLPPDFAFAKNLLDALRDMSPEAKQQLAKDLLGPIYNLPGDYGWAWQNPGAVLGELLASLPPWLQGLLSPLNAIPGMNIVITFTPLVIDADNSGTIDLVSLANSTARFDFWGDGFAEATGWVAAGDGLLVRDLDADGLIENAGELFGSGHPLEYAMAAGLLGTENGFAKLAALDTNADGKIDSNDAAWGELKVWKDTNQDGVSQAGELYALSTLGIASIDTGGYQNAPYYGNGTWGRVIEGNVITHTSTVSMTDASTREIVDAWFAIDLQNTGYTQDYTLDVRTLFLPTARGYGQVKDLHVAMSGDETLLTMVQNFALSRTDAEWFSDAAAVRAEVADILLAWAGVTGPAAGFEHGIFGKLEEFFFLRKWAGIESPYLGTWFDGGPFLPFAGDGMDAIGKTWDNVLDVYTARFVFQSGASSLFGGSASYDPWTDTFTGTDIRLSATAPRREARSAAERVRQLLSERLLTYSADGAAIARLSAANDNGCFGKRSHPRRAELMAA